MLSGGGLRARLGPPPCPTPSFPSWPKLRVASTLRETFKQIPGTRPGPVRPHSSSDSGGGPVLELSRVFPVLSAQWLPHLSRTAPPSCQARPAASPGSKTLEAQRSVSEQLRDVRVQGSPHPQLLLHTHASREIPKTPRRDKKPFPDTCGNLPLGAGDLLAEGSYWDRSLQLACGPPAP